MNAPIKIVAEVDVVIPLYNNRRFIAAAIGSVLSQTLAPVSLTVVDDGSTDGGGDEVQRIFSSITTPVHLDLIRQVNSGPNAARNAGIRKGKAPFVALLDADDLWMPEKLDRQMQRWDRDPSAVMIYCDAMAMDEQGNGIEHPIGNSHGPEGAIFSSLLRRNELGGGSSAVVIKRHVIEKVGYFDTALCTSEDHDMWLRIAQIGNVLAVRAPLVSIRMHGANSTANALHMLKGLLEFDLKWFDQARSRPDVLEYWGHSIALFVSRCSDRNAAIALVNDRLSREQRRLLFKKTFGSVRAYAFLKGLFNS